MNWKRSIIKELERREAEKENERRVMRELWEEATQGKDVILNLDDMGKIKDRIDEIDDLRNSLLEERQELQEKCKHPSYKAGYTSYRLGQASINRICTECYEWPIGEITEEEVKAFEILENKHKPHENRKGNI
jgi:hypothetical protein